ncbi:MAG: phospholipase D-like domain-containing protein [Bacteroidales bacterium]|nr:phospholipase D-like domain-containing protein [Bacteroidales bacterium]
MKKITLSFLCLVILGIQGFSQANIAAARAMPEGSTVTIRGVVTNGSELGIIRYIQDATAGIAAYGSLMTGVDRGDSVVVTGVLKNYNYLLEIDPVNSVNAIAPRPLPAPVVITPAQLKEQYEAILLKMIDVTFANAGGVFSGNTNYNVTANGQTCQVRVNNGSNLVGQIIPAAKVTIIGIGSQFSFANPSTGYQLLLRDKNDIISTSSIVFTTPLAVSNITTNSFSFGWNTNIAGTTELFYGRTPLLELGHLTSAGTGTAHAINISGLNPADLVYVQAFSVAASDTGFSGLKTFITQSASTGNIKTYFSRPVDTTVATGPKAIQLFRAFDDTCIAYISRAKQTIDIAIYNFNLEGISNIANALNAAFARGVAVRIVTDGGTNNSAIPSLVGGIGKISRPVTTGLMHNKFMIIDGQSTNQNDPIVWISSSNLTDQNINTDANNMLFIQDASLAKVYTIEFNEMFGSTTTTPNAANAKWGPAKSDNTPHELIIGGKRVEVYFSPSDGVNQQIVNHINTANSDLEVGTMLITRKIISDAIIARKNAGVTSKVIISSIATSDAGVVADLGAALGNYFRVYNEQGLLHSKAMIVDQSNPASDPFVWTGSHNWSDAANVSNDENSIVIHDAQISNLFYQEFKKRFDLALPFVDHPVLDLGPDTAVFAGDTVTLNAKLFDSYVWSTGELTQSIKVDSSGTGYAVKKIYCRVTNQYGTQSDTIRITFKYGLGYGEQNALVSRFNIYPNPGSGNFSIDFNSKGIKPVSFDLMTFDGRVVWHTQTTTQQGLNTVKVDRADLPSGIYLIRMQTPEGNLGRKLIVK